MSTLANNLKKYRNQSGYTQQQIADLLGIDRSTYSYYETGKSLPDIKNISKLLKILDVSYNELLESNENLDLVGDIVSKDSYISSLTEDENKLLVNYRNLSFSDRKKCLSFISNLSK